MSEDIVKLKQAHERAVYELNLQLADMRIAKTRADKRAQLAHEGTGVLLIIIERYHKAMRALGWASPDDETALVEAVRKQVES